MERKIGSLNTFVERVAKHNQLLSAEQQNQWLQYKRENPQADALAWLQSQGLVSLQQAEIIQKKFVEMGGQLPAAPEPADPIHDESAPEESVPSAVNVQAEPVPDEPVRDDSIPASPEAEAYEAFQAEPVPAPDVDDEPPQVTAEPQPSALMTDIIRKAAELKASDCHLVPGMPVMLRVDGQMTALEQQPLAEDQVQNAVFSLLTQRPSDVSEKGMTEGSTEIEGQRIRYTIVKGLDGWQGAFRLVPPDPPRFDQMGFPESIKNLTDYREGLVLVTGPTGAGKSTTLAAMVNHINQSRHEHILMLEDPIETVFPMQRSHISQRSVGHHTRSFAAALRAALREDPDVIVIGELRDRETTSLAVSAAETGHLVFATLHTTSAPQTLYRLLDFFPPDQRNQVRAMISESLRGVICQRLIPRADGQGRVLAQEIMLNVPAIANIIREDRLYQLPNTIQINRQFGMQLLDEVLQEMLKQGTITGEEAYFAANVRKPFAQFAPQLTPQEAVNG